MSTKYQWTSRIWHIVYILTSVVIALILFALIILTVIFALSRNVPNKYAVVVDAGSTSSKLTLYTWKDNPYRTNGLVEQLVDIKVSPGISEHVDNPVEAYTDIKEGLNELTPIIPAGMLPRTPIYLAATAGIRLLLVTQPLASLDLLEQLRKLLRTSGFLTEVPNERIRILSGSEEGLYGWVSVNYLARTFGSVSQNPAKPTFGSLDMGGASTQIAFVPLIQPQSLAQRRDFYDIRLFGRDYHVYSHSFLCYGKSAFRQRLWATIIHQFTGTSPDIENPCYPKGYTETVDLQDLSTFSCVTGPFARRTFGYDIIIKPGNLTFKGSGDPKKCYDMIDGLFNTTTCQISPCSFNDVYQPTLEGKFYAYSGFSYFMRFFNFTSPTGDYTRKEVADKVRQFCRTPWEQVMNQMDDGETTQVASYCLDGLYTERLLHAYGFVTDESWRNIIFGSKIKGKTVSWAPGYMLDASGRLPSESAKIDLGIPAFVAAMVVLILALIAAIVLLIISLRHRIINTTVNNNQHFNTGTL